MSADHVRLLCLSNCRTLQHELDMLGIQVTYDTSDAGVDGVVVNDPKEAELFIARQMQPLAQPSLLLVYGDRIPYGFAEEMQTLFLAPQWEVVRLFSFVGGERALIGGSPTGTWITRLRRQLADREVISLVCRIREVDEAARQLPLYLAWKERFYLQLGRSCDETGARLEVVSRALGMDKRIGQGWLTGQPGEESLIPEWLAEECFKLVQKANVRRIALWGSERVWQRIPYLWTGDKEVRVYIPTHLRKPNKPIFQGHVCDSWEETLAGADLLVIGETDEHLRELALSEIVNRMNSPVVIDACACFPLQEAEAFSLCYRTVGQNTNVWEWNGL